MNTISEYDLRQLIRIFECLNDFKNAQLSLRKLIADIEALLAVLKPHDYEIVGKLHQEWETLEQLYSYAEAMNDGQMDSGGEEKIRDAVDVMYFSLKEFLERTDKS